MIDGRTKSKILEHIGEGVVVTDDQGIIRYVNPQLEAMFGYDRDELIGEHVDRLNTSPLHTTETFIKNILKAVNSTGSWSGEFHNLHKDGTTFITKSNISTTDVDGSTWFISVQSDITERKRAEADLRNAHDELEQRVAKRTAQLESMFKELQKKDDMLLQQSRLAAMGEMINNIAHQWRQPLNVLGLHLQQIQMFYEGDPSVKMAIKNSVGESMKLIQHMSTTIDDFRSFFRPTKEKTRFSLSEAINHTVQLIYDSFKYQDLKLHVLVEEDAYVHGFKREFCQALLNILQNARDVFLERQVTEGQVWIRLSKREGNTILTIKDNAGGIPEKVLPHLFEPYFSTKGLQGTGIGLYMTKVIVEEHMYGKVFANNNPDGAEFTIAIPEEIIVCSNS